jgi:hypothetical protein
MKLQKALVGRSIRFLRITSGQENVFVPDFVRGFQEMFRFVDVPQRLEDFDTSKGATFRHGFFRGAVIDLFQIYENGVLAEGKVNTDVCDELISAVLVWGAEKFNVTYTDEANQRRAYVSELETVSDKELMKTLSKLKAIGDLLGEKVASYGRECPPFHPSGVHLAPNFNEEGVNAAGRFLLERRGGVPFERNVYFSTAPLATSDHLAVLERLEEVL